MYKEESDYAVLDAVSAIATERGVSNAEVALAWLLAQPGVTAPIVGASKLEHIDTAVKAVELRLSKDETTALGKAYVPHPVLGHS
jgi:aryl-alcohol dehydrogenase (NADP+)